MNWDAIGAVGQIAGALSVMLSLVYLASQIRVSNAASKQANMQELMHESTTFLGRISSNPETCNVWSKGLVEPETLSRSELDQFGILCLEVTLIYERVHYLNKSVDIEPVMAHSLTRSIQGILGSPGYRSWFEERQNDFTAEFRDWILKEEKLANDYVPFYLKYNKD